MPRLDFALILVPGSLNVSSSCQRRLNQRSADARCARAVSRPILVRPLPGKHYREFLGQRAPEVRLADQRGPGRERAKNVVFGMAGGADDVNIRMPSAHLLSQLRSVHAARQTEIGEQHVDAPSCSRRWSACVAFSAVATRNPNGGFWSRSSRRRRPAKAVASVSEWCTGLSSSPGATSASTATSAMARP